MSQATSCWTFPTVLGSSKQQRVYHCDSRALPSFLDWLSGKQGVVWVVIIQKLVADVAFINTVCSRPFLVRQGWNLA